MKNVFNKEKNGYIFNQSTNFMKLQKKTVLFQTIHFSVSALLKFQKQFYFKEFSLALVHRFNVKKEFYFKQFSLALAYSLVLFDS